MRCPMEIPGPMEETGHRVLALQEDLAVYASYGRVCAPAPSSRNPSPPPLGDHCLLCPGACFLFGGHGHLGRISDLTWYLSLSDLFHLV